MCKGHAAVSSRLVLAKSRLGLMTLMTAFLTARLLVPAWADKAEPAPWRQNRIERAR